MRRGLSDRVRVLLDTYAGLDLRRASTPLPCTLSTSEWVKYTLAAKLLGYTEPRANRS
ncbi:hypothetical protein [Nonomuraea dietziae]|uniref:hypothetical protein n=1 Tax=Nonomuraea dietziae TaxID=65515 RepID=UPI00343E219B